MNNNVLLTPELPHFESEVLYAIWREMAVKPNDVICWRLGVGIVNKE